MEIQALKIFNSIKLILFLILVLGVITVLTACGDLVKESDANACNSAIDARNYDEALSVCTSRKDKASAYMGKAGYDIVNLIKSSGTSTSTLTDPTGSNLGKDDNVGASILNILQLSVADIADKNTRAAAISSSRTNLDSASALLQSSLGDNSSSPLTTDEILLNTFAISFAMQLNQLEIYDNATTSKYISPKGDNVTLLDCEQVDNVEVAAAVLIPMDGHIWAKERNGMSCARMKKAIVGLPSDNYTAAYDNLTAWQTNGGLLPEIFREEVCTPVKTLTTYMTSLAANIIELKKTISLSGDNTKAITKADNSTNELMKAVGCKE